MYVQHMMEKVKVVYTYVRMYVQHMMEKVKVVRIYIRKYVHTPQSEAFRVRAPYHTGVS